MRFNKHGIRILTDKASSKEREVRKIARKIGWHVIAHQRENRMLSFERGFERINVYYSNMTVATCIDHPKKGKTQLFRKNVGFSTLEKLFVDPRHHTETGYYRK